MLHEVTKMLNFVILLTLTQNVGKEMFLLRYHMFIFKLSRSTFLLGTSLLSPLKFLFGLGVTLLPIKLGSSCVSRYGKNNSSENPHQMQSFFLLGQTNVKLLVFKDFKSKILCMSRKKYVICQFWKKKKIHFNI